MLLRMLNDKYRLEEIRDRQIELFGYADDEVIADLSCIKDEIERMLDHSC